MNKTNTLIALAQKLADATPEFHRIKGAGTGDRATNTFMKELRALARDCFGEDHSEHRVVDGAKFAVDYWFPDEGTIVEIALSLRNSQSEFHKDLFKALLAVDSGRKVKHIVFVSKPGAIKRHDEPASKAIRNWMKKYYGVETKIVELK